MPHRSYLKNGAVKLCRNPLGKPVWSSAHKGVVIGTVVYASPGSSFVRLKTSTNGRLGSIDVNRA